MKLLERYRLRAASFRDMHGARFRELLGDRAGEALDLILHVLAVDLEALPEELDRERIASVLGTILPGRIAGDEPYRHDLPDLLEEFLMHLAVEEGLATQWEWTSAVAEGRALYDSALGNPDRPRYGSNLHREPDRRKAAKIGRNDPCPCGSGRKFKHCCWKL